MVVVRIIVTGMILLAVVAPARAGFTLVALSESDVTSFDQTGTPTTLVTGLINDSPGAFTFDSSGNIYVTYHHEPSGATEVHKFSSTGADLGTFTNTGTNTGPVGLAFDPTGNLLVGLQNIATIEKYSATGQDLGAFSAGFLPSGLVFDKAGNLFVSAEVQHFIREFPAGGGSPSDISTGVVFPYEMAFDSSGDMLVADLMKGILKVTFTSGGAVNSVTSFTSANPALFGGIAVDSQDNVYVGTLGGIEKFSPSGQDLGLFASTSATSWLAFVPEPATTAVPEPAPLSIFGLGLAVMVAGWRRSKVWPAG